MIYKEKFIERLLKFAHHLSSGRLYERYCPMSPPAGRTEEEPPVFATDDGIVFAYFTFVVEELPFLFPEYWALDEDDMPFLKGKSQLEPHEACAEFFGLSPKEFMHIATPNAQQRNWGGITLPYHAVPQDIGYQIFELVGMHMRMN